MFPSCRHSGYRFLFDLSKHIHRAMVRIHNLGTGVAQTSSWVVDLVDRVDYRDGGGACWRGADCGDSDAVADGGACEGARTSTGPALLEQESPFQIRPSLASYSTVPSLVERAV